MVEQMKNGPDFLCAGMPRAGTSWLYEQLASHPDFWMPPIKELHYFDTAFPKPPYVKAIERILSNPEKHSSKREQKHMRPLTDRDVAFYYDALACRGKDIDFELYGNLFRHKQDLLSGDMTPNYCELADELVAQIAEALPNLKILLLIRDPVSRFWSRSVMRARKSSDFSLDELSDPKRLQKHIDTRSATTTGKQTEIYALWKRHFPAQIRFYFLDDLSEDPVAQRNEILTFLGADPAKKSGELDADYNRKSKFEKTDMPDQVRDTLVAHFADEMRKSVDVFGPKAANWLKRYNLGS
jgi:hypothetical protein